MSEKTVVETVYGKYSKYEIIKETSVLSSPKFYIWKDGKPYQGSFSSLNAAVDAAKKGS